MTMSFACAEYATEFNHRKVERGQINRTVDSLKQPP